jgi:trk system potassium uptake protein TrkH
MKTALLANLGFVLQIAGIFVLIPIVVSLILGETTATVGLFIAASTFLALGFFLNALCERKELSFKQSCTLTVLVFVVFSLVGALPYLYIGIPSGPPLQRITDSIFDSTSGFTTTGFTVLPDISALPQSMILYRGITQFVGGIGIVLIMLAFFYPEIKLKELARSLGFSGKNQKIKKTFFIILSIYCSYTIIAIGLGYIFGYHDLINLACFIFAALGTGGLTPISDVGAVFTQPPLNILIPISMVLGATNFALIAQLFNRKFKDFFKSEFTFFMVVAAASIIALTYFFNISTYDATFQILSTMSTCGYSYLNIAAFADNLKIFIISLMFIGGASLSTAGGIKIYRLIVLLKSVKKAIVDTITQRDSKLSVLGKDYPDPMIIQTGAFVLLTLGIIFVSSLIITTFGYTPINAAFEATSAMATTGLSVGIVSPTLALPLKWLFICLMLVGRVEIITFLVMFSRTKEPHHSNNHCKKSRNPLRRRSRAKPKTEPAPEEAAVEPLESPPESPAPSEPQPEPQPKESTVEVESDENRSSELP